LALGIVLSSVGGSESGFGGKNKFAKAAAFSLSAAYVSMILHSPFFLCKVGIQLAPPSDMGFLGNLLALQIPCSSIFSSQFF
jgi:hypothetical protein